MAYDIDINTVSPVPTAVVKTRASISNLSTAIMPALDKVYAAFDGPAKNHLGHNIVFYPDGAGLMTPQGAPIEVGVQVKTPVQGSGDVVVSQTPGGRVAHTAYWGAYQGLSAAHQALHQFCAANGHKITGVNWEVYGDASDDPLKQRVDVYYQLA